MLRELAATRSGSKSIAGDNGTQQVPFVAGVLTSFKADSDNDDLDPRTKIPLRESPFLNKYPRMKEFPCTPQRKRISNNGYNSVVPSADKSTSPFRTPSDGISGSADDASVRDSGFWELPSVEAERPSHSSPWSMQRRQSPSLCSDYDDSVGKADWESFVGANSSKGRQSAVLRSHSPESIQETTPQNPFGGANLPSYIKLRPEKSISVGNAAKDEDEEHTVYGSLFEQLDPWSTVGLILGLREMTASENNSRSSSLPPDCNSQAENIDFETTTMVPQTRVDELWDYDEDFDSLFNVTWETSSSVPHPMGMDVIEVDLVPTLSPRELTSPASPSGSFVEYSGDVDAHWGGDDEIQPLDSNESSTSQRESKEHSNVTLFAGLGDSDESMDTCGKSNGGRGEGNPSRKYVPQCFKEPEYQQDDELVEMLDADVHGRSENGMDCDGTGGRNFDVPSLREVDGRFVGPTLFDDFDNSEEE